MQLILLMLISSLFLFGCAPTTTVKKNEMIFFPPAPTPPRVQFLLGIGSSRDVERSESEFSLFSMNEVVSEEVKTLSKPYGIIANGSKLYVSDTIAGTVAVIDLQQKSFNWLAGDFGPGKLKTPINLAKDSTGNLYVADVDRQQVVAYDTEGNFLRVYGSGYDMKPVDVAVDDRHLYLLDITRNKILVFNKANGELINGLGQDSENPAERLQLPSNLTLTERGIFYVANIGSGSIVKLDREGNVLGVFGKMGDGFGQFARPRGLVTDSNKRLYVVDAAFQNVQLFNDEDRLLMFFGGPGLPVGSLNIPAGIDVTDQDLDFYQQFAAPGFELEQVILVVSQVGRYKINIYGLGKQQGIDYEAYYQKNLEKIRKADENRIMKKQE